jgi:hypothetical protein
MPADLTSALKLFNAALEYILEAGLEKELEWQRLVRFEDFTETQFLRETAWVILCAGFRESVVRRIFDHISLSFCDWESAQVIFEARDCCRTAALASFRHERKLDAVLEIVELVHLEGFASFKSKVFEDPIMRLQCLPYIGPITAFHLAKNLGLDVAKPDRHLVRLSKELGYRCPAELCMAIAKATGEQVKVIDLALWRYMADIHPVLRV